MGLLGFHHALAPHHGPFVLGFVLANLMGLIVVPYWTKQMGLIVMGPCDLRPIGPNTGLG